LRVAVDNNIADALLSAGQEGLTIDEIAARVPTVPKAKLGTFMFQRYFAGSTENSHIMAGRLLRLLAVNHIFREVSPGRYANNRMSSILATGRPLDDLFNGPCAIPSLQSAFFLTRVILQTGAEVRGDQRLRSYYWPFVRNFHKLLFWVFILTCIKKLG
jgi:hypothetical protein